jgi:hypothetical protein
MAKIYNFYSNRLMHRNNEFAFVSQMYHFQRYQRLREEIAPIIMKLHQLFKKPTLTSLAKTCG